MMRSLAKAMQIDDDDSAGHCLQGPAADRSRMRLSPVAVNVVETAGFPSTTRLSAMRRMCARVASELGHSPPQVTEAPLSDDHRTAPARNELFAKTEND